MSLLRGKPAQEPPAHDPDTVVGGSGAENGDRGARVLVRVQEQVEDAKVEIDESGRVALCLRPGLIGSRAFVALVLALAPLAEQSYQYLQRAG